MALGVLVLGGCGGDDSDTTEAQPLPDASTYQEGGFDELPRFRGAEAISEPAVEGDVTSQSYLATSASSERVIDYYASQLEAAGWDVVDEPAQIGAGETYRGVWRRGDRRLVVSATTASGVASDDPGAANYTQYSLSLGPA